MSDYFLSEETRARLARISTASVATALYKRGLRNQFIQGVSPNADRPQRVAMKTCPPGWVLVMDSSSKGGHPNCSALR